MDRAAASLVRDRCKKRTCSHDSGATQPMVRRAVFDQTPSTECHSDPTDEEELHTVAVRSKRVKKQVRKLFGRRGILVYEQPYVHGYGNMVVFSAVSMRGETPDASTDQLMQCASAMGEMQKLDGFNEPVALLHTAAPNQPIAHCFCGRHVHAVCVASLTASHGRTHVLVGDCCRWRFRQTCFSNSDTVDTVAATGSREMDTHTLMQLRKVCRLMLGLTMDWADDVNGAATALDTTQNATD